MSDAEGATPPAASVPGTHGSEDWWSVWLGLGIFALSSGVPVGVVFWVSYPCWLANWVVRGV